MGVTAFIVRVPEAEPCVRELRLRYDATARLGVPAHVTILGPFMDAAHISADVLERVTRAIRSVPSFDFRLAAVGRFPSVAYLAPEPAEPFVALTLALVAAFPDYPPYEGRHDGITPHLTAAFGTEEDAEDAAKELAKWLRENGPIRARCAEVVLLENREGRWSEMHAFALAGGGGGRP